MVSRFFDVKSIAWRHLYIIGVRRTSEELEKKLLRKFGGFKKLSYLCIRNLKERVSEVSGARLGFGYDGS